jgi:hypothetical protein
MSIQSASTTSSDDNTPYDTVRPVGYEERTGTSKQPAPLDHAHIIQVEDWKELTLENDWVPYNPDVLLPSYLLDPMGFVHLEGAIKDGITTGLTSITTLPVGYRPKRQCIWFGFDNVGALVTGYVYTDGQVKIDWGASVAVLQFTIIYEADRDMYVQSRS